jgi:hypothetical protein
MKIRRHRTSFLTSTGVLAVLGALAAVAWVLVLLQS